MKNYICINGNMTELTDAQVAELGFEAPDGRIAKLVADLSEKLQGGYARNHFSIGDTITFGDLAMEIIGINHDKDAEHRDCNTITLMSRKLLEPRRWHDGACPGGWADSEIREWLNGEFINTLPPELIPHICTVGKLTHTSDGEAIKTLDRLFIPSESELFGSAIWAAAEDGERYEAFKTSADRMCYDADGDPSWYWTRSPGGGSSAGVALVGGDGAASYANATDSAIRVAFGFAFA